MSAHSDNRRPSEEDILKAIQASGYLFEREVGQCFEEAGYFVNYNASYEDQDEGKSREIDVIAREYLAFAPPSGSEAWLSINIIASCIDTIKPVVFFTRQIPPTALPGGYCVNVVGPAFEWPSYEDREKRPDTVQSRAFDFFKNNDHRLVTPIISSQFCIIERKKSGWQATKGAFYNDVLVSLIKAVHYREKLESNLLDIFNAVIIYPVIVLRDELYTCGLSTESPYLSRSESVVLYSQYFSKSVQGHFLIDVITRSYLDHYIALIRAETEKLREFLEENFQQIQEYVKRRKSEQGPKITWI